MWRRRYEKKTLFKMPKALGACADMLMELKTERMDLQKTVDGLKKKEELIKEHLINELPVTQATGVSGKIATVLVESREVPQVDDWDEMIAWVIKTKSLDILTKAISKEAVRARWDNGVEVPGVKKFKAKVISLTKV